MAKGNVDLTSKEWRDLIFQGKNTEFGAYQLRKNSDKRHNMAFLYMIIGLVVVVIMVIGYNKWSDYREAQKELELKEQREKMLAAMAEVEEETPEEEPEQEKFEQKIEEPPQEVLSTVQVTQINIVEKEKYQEDKAVQDINDLKQETTTFGAQTVKGNSDDVDNAPTAPVPPAPPAPPAEPKKLDEKKEDDKTIFTAVEQQAAFPGGEKAMMNWLSKNINYPQAAADNGIQGRVIVKFVVEKDGSIGNVTVVKGVDKDLDKEAIRVVKKMPKWQPGKNNGAAVRSYFNLPVTFKLAN